MNILGSSGTAKSVIAALYRLAEFDGDLLIDGVDVKKVNLSDLRSRISIITDDPIFFASTLRKNLDPLSQFDDVILWSALDDVELKHKFYSLDYPINPQDSNLTKNQRYLFCFARAIIKKNKILLLDGVAENVDSDLKALIQNVIRTKFEDCTVLTITRQWNSVEDDEKILIVERGFDCDLE